MMSHQELLKALEKPQAKPEDTLCPPIELHDIPATDKKDASTQKRCGCCKKKLTLTDFACDKCQTRYCSTHRLPEEHTCSHDFKAAGKTQLTKQLVAAIADKVGDRL